MMKETPVEGSTEGDRRQDDGDDQSPPPDTSAAAGTAVLHVLREVAVVLVVALGLSLLLKTFLVQAFLIPSGSMEQTLLVGDRVLVSKLTPGPFDLRRGDVVVFSDPGDWLEPEAHPSEGRVRDAVHSTLTFVGLLPADSDEHLIKRLIGLPGDHVVGGGTGPVTVNGVPIEEPYVHSRGNLPSEKPFDVTVPAGHIWVMGDHRDGSSDSRYHLDQPVPIGNVVGRTFVKVWPLQRFGLLHQPTSTFARVHGP
jgi:signal peptidase I